MSECVVRMEMPEGCWCCPFGHYDWIWGDDGREKMVCFCRLDFESEEEGHHLLETELKRPSWCPIVCSLPEWHGRLIDADAILNDKGNYFTLGGMGGGDRYYHETILEYSPAIVPAEAERSET